MRFVTEYRHPLSLGRNRGRVQRVGNVIDSVSLLAEVPETEEPIPLLYLGWWIDAQPVGILSGAPLRAIRGVDGGYTFPFNGIGTNAATLLEYDIEVPRSGMLYVVTWDRVPAYPGDTR